jgi:di/tricarboxylate transporter
MAFLLGFAPNPTNPKVLLGTSAGLGLAFSGFANTALALVASALFIAAAMTATGLDKRIALTILSRVGGEVHHVAPRVPMTPVVSNPCRRSRNARLPASPGCGR